MRADFSVCVFFTRPSRTARCGAPAPRHHTRPSRTAAPQSHCHAEGLALAAALAAEISAANAATTTQIKAFFASLGEINDLSRGAGDTLVSDSDALADNAPVVIPFKPDKAPTASTEDLLDQVVRAARAGDRILEGRQWLLFEGVDAREHQGVELLAGASPAAVAAARVSVAAVDEMMVVVKSTAYFYQRHHTRAAEVAAAGGTGVFEWRRACAAESLDPPKQMPPEHLRASLVRHPPAPQTAATGQASNSRNGAEAAEGAEGAEAAVRSRHSSTTHWGHARRALGARGRGTSTAAPQEGVEGPRPTVRPTNQPEQQQQGQLGQRADQRPNPVYSGGGIFSIQPREKQQQQMVAAYAMAKAAWLDD
jgi:hypothetical protein